MISCTLAYIGCVTFSRRSQSAQLSESVTDTGLFFWRFSVSPLLLFCLCLRVRQSSPVKEYTIPLKKTTEQARKRHKTGEFEAKLLRTCRCVKLVIKYRQSENPFEKLRFSNNANSIKD